MARMLETLVLVLVTTTAAVAGGVSGELSRPPWSGSFWPLRTCWMSFGNWGQGLAPFEKYDNYVSATRGSNPGAAAREADPENGHNEAADRNGEGWTGHCHGWAPASMMEPEPPVEVLIKFDRSVRLFELGVSDASRVRPGFGKKLADAYVTRDGSGEKALELATADTKAMLTEIYCETRSNSWGHRWNGRSRDHEAEAYLDVKPHVMHELLVHYIKEKDQGLVFDIDPGYMVWNQPVYKFESRWTQQGDRLDVETTVHWANDNGVSPDFHGLQSVSRTYTYTMTLDSSGNVVGSQWTGASIDDHPDFIWQPYGVIDEANAAGLDLDVVHEMIANDGKTVTVRDAGTIPETPGENHAGREGFWSRLRDRLDHIFGRH